MNGAISSKTRKSGVADFEYELTAESHRVRLGILQKHTIIHQRRKSCRYPHSIRSIELLDWQRHVNVGSHSLT